MEYSYLLLFFAVTVFMYLCLIALILSEILYYRTSRIYNKFVPDIDYDDKLKINVDMTIAMRCQSTCMDINRVSVTLKHSASSFNFLIDIGADIVDVTNQESKKFGKFTLQDSWFELTPNQQEAFDDVRRLNSFLRERYHSLRDILWLSDYYSNDFSELPAR